MLFSKGGNLNGTLFFKRRDKQTYYYFCFLIRTPPLITVAKFCSANAKCTSSVISVNEIAWEIYAILWMTVSIFSVKYSPCCSWGITSKICREKKICSDIYDNSNAIYVLHLLPGHNSLVDCLSQVIYGEKYPIKCILFSIWNKYLHPPRKTLWFVSGSSRDHIFHKG